MQQSAARPGLNAFQPDSIVYTPVNETIKDNGQLGLDLNNDGTTDFSLNQKVLKVGDPRTGQTCAATLTLYLAPSQSGNGIVDGAHAGWAAALHQGHRINSLSIFSLSPELLANVGFWNGSPTCPSHNRFNDGYWFSNGTHYLGLEFQIQGSVHYGWAQVTTGSDRSFDVSTTLTGYAYQTVGGRSIKAGQM